jgi:hypothetical protein
LKASQRRWQIIPIIWEGVETGDLVVLVVLAEHDLTAGVEIGGGKVKEELYLVVC